VIVHYFLVSFCLSFSSPWSLSLLVSHWKGLSNYRRSSQAKVIAVWWIGGLLVYIPPSCLKTVLWGSFEFFSSKKASDFLSPHGSNSCSTISNHFMGIMFVVGLMHQMIILRSMSVNNSSDPLLCYDFGFLNWGQVYRFMRCYTVTPPFVGRTGKQHSPTCFKRIWSSLHTYL